MREYGLFVNGRWQPARSRKTVPSLSPATEEPWAQVAAADDSDVDDAVKAARAAFAEGRFRDKPLEERLAILNDIAAAIFERGEELAQAEAMDSGCTLSKATTADVPSAGQAFL